MYNSSFLKILESRNKIPLNPQLLRLKDWFSRYNFTVKHVKGHNNILVDMLYRPPSIHLITPNGHIPLILMETLTAALSSSSLVNPSALTERAYPLELTEMLPPGQSPSLAQIQDFAKSHLTVYLSQMKNQGFRKIQSNKIQNLVEYTHILESAQIDKTSLHLMNPYTIFKRNKSLARKINFLIQHRSLLVKEYIQSTTLDNPATVAEQYVDLQIDQQMIDQWIREGFFHLHIGAARFILTLHRRKCLPVTARIALLNTNYKQYEYTFIDTCLSTLHTGSISLTYYPNFNIPLRDHNLHNCLKVQLQVLGVNMLPNTYKATLHHQIAYWLQGHALDLPIPSHTGDTIFITVEREYEIPTIIQIPKQLSREKLKEVIPLEWITNYEKAFQNTTPVISSDTKYVKQRDGSIKTVYESITESEAFSSVLSTHDPTSYLRR
ncbi:hypothetical protein Ddye_004866 [Dipteronia dyeriana]|uniref:Uncharacterized protein n=1 Tax=Dipteronia dyeriana TaxID=168575 RepID=A0AAE0CPP8_9ROSI|nr:hypothetical protein Ddye_004866 [Dipteronia dyeriana]